LAIRWARRSRAEIHCLGYEEAELVKLGTNALRAVAIAFYNELYMIAKSLGADYRKIFELLSPSAVLDSLEGGIWGRKRELAGTPFGGKCLPKDQGSIASRQDIAPEEQHFQSSPSI
jgi:UDP-glucose 6-dehydrogenase